MISKQSLRTMSIHQKKNCEIGDKYILFHCLEEKCSDLQSLLTKEKIHIAERLNELNVLSLLGQFCCRGKYETHKERITCWAWKGNIVVQDENRIGWCSHLVTRASAFLSAVTERSTPQAKFRNLNRRSIPLPIGLCACFQAQWWALN